LLNKRDSVSCAGRCAWPHPDTYFTEPVVVTREVLGAVQAAPYRMRSEGGAVEVLLRIEGTPGPLHREYMSHMT
jgi:hypothetical protein